jgi:PAS domain S-box-containing protein
MPRPIRILFAEDNPSDCELILRELRHAGFEPEWHRVQTEADFIARLSSEPDIILSDFDMPQFTGLRALEVLQERSVDIPFILISGTIGEDTAVKAMQKGAADYLLKDRLTRLGPAVEQALERARLCTERRKGEEALRQSEAEFRAMTEASPLGIFVADCDGSTTYTNATLRRMLGLGFQEIAGDAWTKFVHPLYREQSVEKWREAIASRQNFEGSAGFIRADGSAIQASIKTAVMRGEKDRVLGYVGTVEDITERRRTEARLHEQASMLDHAHEAIIVRDIHTRRITFWNKGAERLYGWTAAEAEGSDIGELIFADHRLPSEINDELLRTGECHREGRQVTKEGRELTVSSHITLVRDAGGIPKSALVINIDITAQKSLEAQFLRAQRMESIGTLASGVAHDLNNILAPIMMSVPLLRMEMSATEREGIISTIEASAERGAQIVKQVLTFGRGIEGHRSPLQAAPLFREIMKIMRGTFPKNITLQTDIDPDLWQVIGDSTQLHQVLLNLCVNARDAMPEGGCLRLSARNLEIDESYASMLLPEVKPGPHVLISVSDTGTGMPPEVASRIFDPFFTTKAIGKGTGLGLSTVLGIVKSHHGHIEVKSDPGRGTTFHLYLPAYLAVKGGVQAPCPIAAVPQGSGETILVVDDEAPVLSAVKGVLESHGYRVLQAADGTEALAVYASNAVTVTAVLTDLMMPFMDGVALIKALRKMKPGLPIIAATGLGEKARLAELDGLGVKAVLHKPFGADSLLQALHEALQPAATA